MIVELSDSENPSAKKKPTTRTTLDRRSQHESIKATLKKSFISLFTPPKQDQVTPEKLVMFLKSKIRIKESFIKKILDTPKSVVLKSLDSKNPNYDPQNSENSLDFLLSVYVSIQKNMNVIEGDDSSSIYNMAKANKDLAKSTKDLVKNNKEKDQIIKKRIQDIIINGLSAANSTNSSIPSYSFVKLLLDVFGQFIKGNEDSIQESQIEAILDYLISLVDQSDELIELGIEEAKISIKKAPPKKTKEDEKSAKSPSLSKDRPKTRPVTAKLAGKHEKETKNVEEVKKISDEDENNIEFVIPAILNFINSYFLSKTPQDVNLSEHRKKRIEKRETLRKKLQNSLNKDNDLKDDLINDSSNTAVEGYDKESVIKKEKIDDDNGKRMICTFARTRRNYENQHWYMCYTCGLHSHQGWCSICAKEWHRGHELVYWKTSSFFWDWQFRFDCKTLPDEYKEANNGRQKRDLDYSNFSYGGDKFAPFGSSNQPPPWREMDRDPYGDYSRGGLFDSKSSGGLFGSSRGGRGRGGRGRGRGGGRPSKKSLQENEYFEVYKKNKKKSYEAARAIKSKTSSKPFWRSNPDNLFDEQLEKYSNLEKQFLHPQDSDIIDERHPPLPDDSDSIDPENEGEDSDEADPLGKKVARGFGGKQKFQDDFGLDLDERSDNIDEMISEEEFLEDQRVMRMFQKEQELARPSKSSQKMRPKRTKMKVKNEFPPDDEGEDNGEGEDDLEGDEDKKMEEIEEDKKIEEVEEDSKSMSSIDAKMEKVSQPLSKSGENKQLEMIEELGEDADMEVENEEILENFDLRLFRIFSNSSQIESLPKKLLEKFQKLLKRIKKRISKSQDKPKSGGANRHRMLESLILNDKKFSFSNIAKTTKR